MDNMLQIFKGYVLSKLREEKGQGMVEYALIIGLVAIVVIAVLVLLGPAIAAKFQSIVDSLK
jgi:pilus assembly protein Flp/PilA